MHVDNIHLAAQTLGYSEIPFNPDWSGSTGYLDNIPADTYQSYFTDDKGRRAVIVKLNPTQGFVVFERYIEQTHVLVGAPLLGCEVPFQGGYLTDMVEDLLQVGYILASHPTMKLMAKAEPTLTFELIFSSLSAEDDAEEWDVRLNRTSLDTIYAVARAVGDYGVGIEQLDTTGRNKVMHPIKWVDDKLVRPQPFDPSIEDEFKPFLAEAYVFKMNPTTANLVGKVILGDDYRPLPADQNPS